MEEEEDEEEDVLQCSQPDIMMHAMPRYHAVCKVCTVQPERAIFKTEVYKTCENEIIAHKCKLSC
jgi:hypothetical protein